MRENKTPLENRIQAENTESALLAQTQFELAICYWDKGDSAKAERWFRYACQQGHVPAQDFLNLGIQLGFFTNVYDHLHIICTQMLEQLITPKPKKLQIQQITTVLLNHLKKHTAY